MTADTNRRLGLAALVVVLLAWALVPTNPYGYYMVMRWVVSAAFLYLALDAHAGQRTFWAWTWAVAAGVYNPIIPVHGTRALWSVVNIITIGLIIFCTLHTSKRPRASLRPSDSNS